MAIVSNNAKEAVDAWLESSNIGEFITVVVGRDPRRMKPDPWPILTAASALSCDIPSCVFLGDSTTDVEAARLADTPMIALANKPQKRLAFEAARCAAIIERLT